MIKIKEYYIKVLEFTNKEIDRIDDIKELELLEELHKTRLEVTKRLEIINAGE